MSRAAKYFWSNGFLWTTPHEFILSYNFCLWIFNKSIAFGNYTSAFGFFASTVVVETIFAVIQPFNVTLLIVNQNSRIEEICRMYSCKSCLINSIYIPILVDKILYPANAMDIAVHITEELINNFQRVSKYLTIVPYFERIERLSDTNFSNINTLIFVEPNDVSLDFLKREFFLNIDVYSYFSMGATQMVCFNNCHRKM
jgi:hypothetical protein